MKEGTLMKVSKKSRQPRHLFLVTIYSACTFFAQYLLKVFVCDAIVKTIKP